MTWDGTERRARREDLSLEGRVSSLETGFQMHVITCERDGKETKATAERIEAKVDRNAEKRQEQHEQNRRAMWRMERALYVAVISVAGLLLWQFFVTKLYVG